jgi:hypothetical protein
MSDFVVSFGLSHHTSDEGRAIYRERQNAMINLVFSLGPAWCGAQGAILLRTDQSIDTLTRKLAELVCDGDFLIVVALSGSMDIRYAGWLVDEENFKAFYPNAKEVPVANTTFRRSDLH